MRDANGAKIAMTHDEVAATRHEIAAMETRLGRTFARWLFARQAAVIGATAVLLAID